MRGFDVNITTRFEPLLPFTPKYLKRRLYLISAEAFQEYQMKLSY